jgi:uncharacterized protein with HEPN domain
MSRHDPLIRVAHMRDHASEAIDLLGDRSIDDLGRDRILQLALVRLVEVIGEAASKVPADFRERHPEVPWREAIAMRNLLVHGYDIIEHRILWQTITSDLPPLLEQLGKVLAGEQGS